MALREDNSIDFYSDYRLVDQEVNKDGKYSGVQIEVDFKSFYIKKELLENQIVFVEEGLEEFVEDELEKFEDLLEDQINISKSVLQRAI